MTWHELKPETRQVLLDAIDRAETAANSVSEATAHDKLPLIPEAGYSCPGSSLITNKRT